MINEYLDEHLPSDKPNRLSEQDNEIIRAKGDRASIYPPTEMSNLNGQGKKKKKQLGTARGVETMFRTIYRVNMDLTSISDSKANIMISVNGIIISIILGTIAPTLNTNFILFWPTVIFLVSCLLSMSCAVLAARPRITHSKLTLDQFRTDKANLLFFGHFSSLSRDDFEIGISELMLNNDRLYRNMIRDVYGIGKVLSKKYYYIQLSYTLFIIGIIASLVAFAWMLFAVN